MACWPQVEVPDRINSDPYEPGPWSSPKSLGTVAVEEFDSSCHHMYTYTYRERYIYVLYICIYIYIYI